MKSPAVPSDAFGRLRLATQARIGLGRAGTGLPTGPMLDFQMAHAMARDALCTDFSDTVVASGLPSRTIAVASRATDRETYLRRPDLGRLLDDESALRLQKLGRGGYDAVIVIADGLSATAAHNHAAAVATMLSDMLRGWHLAPFILAHRARVALADDIGERLGAMMSLILIGERPGLSSPDSLGAYLTWHPRVGRMDSERNCVSNIRPPHGLSHAVAAERIAWLMETARGIGTTGVALKDEYVEGPPRLGAVD